MRAGGLIIAALLTLSGCEVASQSADELARYQAKSVINGVVAEKLPGVDATPVTDCIIDNATASEILTIAGAAVTGVTPATGQLVLDIAQRPETVQCIASNGIARLML